MATAIPTNRVQFSSQEIAEATGGTLHRGEGVEVEGIVTDSRAIGNGMAFVALRGETFDGHAFLPQVEKLGAALAVVEQGPEADASKLPLVVVDDTLVAWGKIARAHLRTWRKHRRDGRVLGLTGSAGKTTTKELCAALLDQVASTHRTAGNLNNRIGLPAVALEVTRDHRFVVLEMGMSVPGEIAVLSEIAEADVAIVTNIGVAHAEGVGGKSGVAREKGAIYEALGEGGIAIVNADDEEAMKQLSRTGALPLFFGRSERADYRLVDRVSRGAVGSTLTLKTPASPAPWSVEFPLSGEANAIDFVAALAGAEALSNHRFSPEEVDRALRTLTMTGRSVMIELLNGTLVIDDTYNANPQSMRAALTILNEVAAGRRKVAILGEMRELGVLSLAEHESLGEALADAHVDLVIGCGGLMNDALRVAESRGVKTIACASTAEAADVAVREVGAGDSVLVKGSRGVRTEVVVEKLKSTHQTKQESERRSS